MKRIILTSILTLTSVIVFGQETKFGLKGGLNIANQTNTPFPGLVQTNSSSLYGFHVGAFIEFNLSDKLTIQPEILLSSEGNKYNFNDFIRESFDSPGEYVNWQVVNNLTYINTPVMIKYYLIEKISLGIGPQIGFLLNSKSNYSFSSPTIGNNSNTYSDGYKSIDYGLNIGACYNFTENISSEFRYNIGLANVNAKSSTEIKNRVISISTIYKF
jgi:opacity protein-like surface antigen